MKILITLFFITSSFTGVFGQARQDTAAVQEAQKISIEVVRLFNEKKFEEALPLARKVIEIREKELGKYDISVAEAWRNLAYIQFQSKDIKGAENSFEKAFNIFEKNQPLSTKQETMFVEMMEIVAFYQATDQKFDKAEKIYLQAVELREKINGKDSPELSSILQRLGRFYQAIEKYEQAAPILFRSFEIKRKMSGKDNEQIAEIFRDVSCVYRKLERTDEIEDIKKELFPDFPDSKILTASGKTGQIQKGVVNGKALSLPRPVYPSTARAKRASGTVNVQVLIDETGNVIHACAVDGAKLLHRVSEISAYGAKFEPTFLDGKPVKVNGIIVYKFVL